MDAMEIVKISYCALLIRYGENIDIERVSNLLGQIVVEGTDMIFLVVFDIRNATKSLEFTR